MLAHRHQNNDPDACPACGGEQPCRPCEILEKEGHVHLLEVSGCSIKNPGHLTGVVWRLDPDEVSRLNLNHLFVIGKRTRVTSDMARQLGLSAPSKRAATAPPSVL
jgi:hypothetical protein